MRFKLRGWPQDMIGISMRNAQTICSSETYFHLDGVVNKHNWRVLRNWNPHIVIYKPFYPQRVAIWWAMSSCGIMSPIYTKTLGTSERYVSVLEIGFIAIMTLISTICADVRWSSTLSDPERV